MCKIKVGFVGPSLYFGGAELWILTLLNNLHSELIEWTYNITAYPLYEESIRHHFRKHLITYVTGIEDNFELSHVSPLAAIAKLCQESDLIIGWELDTLMLKCLNGYHDKVINVMHRNDPSLIETILPEHKVVAVSESCANAIGLDRKRVDIIPNGIDLCRCQPTVKRDVIRETWGVEKDDIVIGYIGRIAKEKNLIKMAYTISECESNVRGIVYGSLMPNSQCILDSITEIAGKRIIIKPPQYEVGNVYNGIDVFFLPSRSEACSLSALEAFYCEVPAVITTESDFIDQLERKYGKICYRVRPDAEPNEIRQIIRDAITSDKNLLACAKQIVKDHYSAAKCAQEWANMLIAASRKSSL